MKKEERYERYKYLTGLSSWEIASYQDPEHVIFCNDGPSGLRKPVHQEFNNQSETIVSVCAPTPSSLAASFDKTLCYKNGELLAKECLHHKTNILLAPGVNIKSYVLCGRNFEYFSEDPYLAGVLAANYVNGIEDLNVGTCVKHYAVNSQEHARTINSSEVSLRALNEIYLGVFKYTLKYSNPTSIMTSYNRVNGEYVNESEYLIQKKLRNEYNFKGLIMSDWGAVSNKWKGIATGLDLEMPKTRMSNEYIDRGYGVDFTDEDLIARDNELYNSIKKYKNAKYLDELNLDELHKDAVEIANKTVVLLKNNENYFPLKKSNKVLVLGYFANHNRFVGGGSGWVNAYKPRTILEIFDQNNVNYDFVQCYDEDKLLINEDSLKEYKGKYDKVLLFLGQYQKDESEGTDRITIDLADEQIETLKIVENTFDDFGAVVVTGSVVNVKEIYEKSNSLMITYLAGEGQSEAIYNNLFGESNPSGRLPETWIESIYQNPVNKEYLRRDIYYTYHYDDIYIGYRYYDIHNEGFVLPFGYGLSYSKFNYSNFKTEVDKEQKYINVSLDIENISDVDGEDVIQIYVGKKNSNIYRPLKELKGFEKVLVNKHSKESLTIKVEVANLASYRYATDKMELEDGEYEIYVALNSKEILHTSKVALNGVTFEKELEPRKLEPKKIENVYTFDSPAGLLFDNEIFKDYARKNLPQIDVEDFETKKWYLDSRPLRGTINDYELNMSFEELEALINHLNKHEKHVDEHINFDEYIIPFHKIGKW